MKTKKKKNFLCYNVFHFLWFQVSFWDHQYVFQVHTIHNYTMYGKWYLVIYLYLPICRTTIHLKLNGSNPILLCEHQGFGKFSNTVRVFFKKFFYHTLKRFTISLTLFWECFQFHTPLVLITSNWNVTYVSTNRYRSLLWSTGLNKGYVPIHHRNLNLFNLLLSIPEFYRILQRHCWYWYCNETQHWKSAVVIHECDNREKR